jgi:hypothetical protein
VCVLPVLGDDRLKKNGWESTQQNYLGEPLRHLGGFGALRLAAHAGICTREPFEHHAPAQGGVIAAAHSFLSRHFLSSSHDIE